MGAHPPTWRARALGRGETGSLVVLAGACLLLLAGPVSAPAQEGRTAGREGLLVVEAARDTSQDFRWIERPEVRRRWLVWSSGMLSVPDSLQVTDFGVADLMVPYSPQLAGLSAGRRLLFTPGRYRVRGTTYLSDGRLDLILSAGELRIEAGRVVYSGAVADRRQRAQYLMLAGIVILVTTLMLRARSRLRRR
jgi:hypothetical protein